MDFFEKKKHDYFFLVQATSGTTKRHKLVFCSEIQRAFNKEHTSLK